MLFDFWQHLTHALPYAQAARDSGFGTYFMDQHLVKDYVDARAIDAGRRARVRREDKS